MKTKIDYQIERFKKRYHYDGSGETIKTITFTNYNKDQLEIPIDIGIGDQMTEFFDMGDDGIFTRKIPRETQVDIGIINVPIIHLCKYFFECKPYIQDWVIHHEIGHLLLQGLNTFTLDTKFLPQELFIPMFMHIILIKLKMKIQNLYI